MSGIDKINELFDSSQLDRSRCVLHATARINIDLILVPQEDKRNNEITNHYDDRISKLKHKLMSDDLAYRNKDAYEPPYLRKRNRRLKSIYVSMHDNDVKRKSNHRNKAIKPSEFGRLEYQQFIHKNEIPDADFLTQLLEKSRQSIDHKQHHKKHHYSRSHDRIQKLRSKPEAGIMQKKIKIWTYKFLG